MSAYRKLQQARLLLQGRKLKKSGNNKFAGYDYFELGDFLPAVQEIFMEVGLCGTVSYTTDLALLKIVDVDDPQSEILFTSPMGSANLKGCHEVQNIGAVETYQRRYLWVTAMEIVEHDALDATTGNGGVERNGEKVTPTAGAWEALDDEEQAYLQGVADEIISLFDKSPLEAHARLKAEGLDTDELVALKTRFDSRVRATFAGADAIQNAQTMDALKDAWSRIPKHAREALGPLKDQRKAALEQPVSQQNA